jgi:hypothetical protein
MTPATSAAPFPTYMGAQCRGLYVDHTVHNAAPTLLTIMLCSMPAFVLSSLVPDDRGAWGQCLVGGVYVLCAIYLDRKGAL